ncbi:MAG: VCBS repeat-containing protein [Fibrobacteria bacterium]
MRQRRFFIHLLLLPLIISLARPYLASAAPDFRVHLLEGTAGGGRETLLAADIDKDGDVDFFTGENGGPTEWFENDPEGWKRHPVSDSADTYVGGVALDVDGDGWIDKAAGSFWYRNTGHPREGGFIACKDIAPSRPGEMQAADLDGDGVQDVISIDSTGLAWYSVPRDSACLPWTEHKVTGSEADKLKRGGIAAGDLDGDGDADIASLDRWYENADGEGLAWIEHKNIDFGRADRDSVGVSGKALILDMDGDGKYDLLEAECDTRKGRIAWFRNADGKGLLWERHIIEDSAMEQDFHSLAAADFNGDGHLDVFSIGGPATPGIPLGFIWENDDGKGLAWTRNIILEKKMGYEGVAADVDGDGDMDILLKPSSFAERYWLENLRLDPAAILPPGAKSGGSNGTALNGGPEGRFAPYQPRYRRLGRAYDAKGKTMGIQRLR